MSSSSADLPTSEGPGSVSGAPNLPAGFTGTFTSRYVDTGELRLHAVSGGGGPPLLLIHGWPQTWYAWRMLMPTLARDFFVIAVDQRGIGLSDKPQDGYDTATLANDMVALMNALGHQRFALYGTDVGMPIAYAPAADHRDRPRIPAPCPAVAAHPDRQRPDRPALGQRVTRPEFTTCLGSTRR
jgi:pimeloyl-ACP methyl ester carboxylesterase